MSGATLTKNANYPNGVNGLIPGTPTSAQNVAPGNGDGGKGITDTPQGLKLQCEGHDVRYRNIWIQKLDLAKPETDFTEKVKGDDK